jgi:hypothetical protein
LRKWVVCIVDSDKISPFCDASTKTRKLEEIVKTTEWKFVKLIVLDCHEIENVLHPKLVLGLPCGAQYRSADIINRLISLEEDLFGENSIWRYLDVKDGIDSDKLAKLEGKRAEWLRGKMKLLGLEEDGFVIAGFGDGVISSLNRSVDRHQLLSRYTINNASWNTAFRGVFNDLAWRFVGRTPIYT